MFEEIAEMRREAAAVGIATVIWSYPRGEALDKDGETAIDIAAYAAQIAALLGAHIIKIKLSTDHLSLKEAKSVYQDEAIDIANPSSARPKLRRQRLCRTPHHGVLGRVEKRCRRHL